jgi:hypothetical protein
VRGRTLALFELLWLVAGVGCRHPETHAAKAQASGAASVPSALASVLAPRAASRFVCAGDKCRQAQPRLPDTGEWRCAELGQVVWCAGGEPAAGVVSGPRAAGYRCGPRWGNGDERVCIDQQPDYPTDRGETFKCGFEQEHGIARVCRAEQTLARRALPERALPACWLDRDCPSGGCERGACRCTTAAECRAGRCEAGLCVEATP